MNIYVWDDFCPNWSSGLAVVIAKTKKHAREILWKRCCDDGLDYKYIKEEIYNKDPLEMSMQEIAFYVQGGS